MENGTPGFTLNTLKRKLMWRGSNTAELFFHNCRVPSDAMLGNPGDGFKQMLATLDGGRLSIGAMGLGCAQGAYEAALRYSKERIKFGRPICKQQGRPNWTRSLEYRRAALYAPWAQPRPMAPMERRPPSRV